MRYFGFCRFRFDGTDFVKILDFGISKFNNPQLGAESGGLSLTRTGALMGTPYYLSPEQASGSKSVDQRTDLYTVGVILYECLTGVVPHAADTFNELLFRIVLEPPAGTAGVLPIWGKPARSSTARMLATHRHERLPASGASSTANHPSRALSSLRPLRTARLA